MAVDDPSTRARRATRVAADAAVVLGVGAVYYVTARLSLRLSLVERNVTPIWPPTGIAVAALLVYGRRVWPAIAGAAFLVNLPISPSALTAGTIAAGNTIAPVAAVLLLRRAGFRSDIERLRDALAIVLAALVAMTISATIGTVSLVSAGVVPPREFLASWSVWWAGDAMGVLIVAPFLMGLRVWRRPMGWRRAGEYALVLGAAVTASHAAFASDLHIQYVVFPVLAWAAWRFGLAGAAPAALAVSLVAVRAAVDGAGPFATESLIGKMVGLQLFNGGVALTSFVLAALMAERARSADALRRAGAELEERVAVRTRELREANERLADEIAERERTAGRLDLAGRQLAHAQTIARLGSWEWDVDADAVTWSDELFRIFGLAPGEIHVTYAAFLERIHPDDRRRIEVEVERGFSDGRPLMFDHRIVRSDGAVRVLHCRGEVCRDASGRTVRMMGTSQDVTERTQAEDALREALVKEHEAVEQLRTLDSMKDSLMMAVSHELRTPLTVVRGLAETLQRPEVARSPEITRDLLARLSSNALRLERLLADLLDLDRLRRGIIAPRRRPTDLAELFARVIERFDLRGHGVEIEAPAGEALIDPAQVERIVENLVVNAIKHTPGGTPIWVRADLRAGGVLVMIDDAGPGVPDEIKDAVFEPFRRGATPEYAPGTGVGLTLVSRFARLHGGAAWVQDRPGGGASFRVWLPEGPGAVAGDPVPGESAREVAWGSTARVVPQRPEAAAGGA